MATSVFPPGGAARAGARGTDRGGAVDVWAVVVWNVVFDRVIVVAGRRYLHAAALAAAAGGPYARIDDWMRPAVNAALWMASAAAAAILLLGWFGVRLAAAVRSDLRRSR